MMFLYIFMPYQDQLYVSETVGAFNVVSDIYLLCLPIAAVSRLQLPTRKKVGIISVFLTGLLWVPTRSQGGQILPLLIHKLLVLW